MAKTQLLARRMRQLISAALEAIYSEQFDMSALVNSLSGSKDSIHLLRAYIAIGVATRLSEPASDAQIEEAVEQFCAAQSHLNTSDFDAILDLHRQLAELHWLRKQEAILRGKLAHRHDEYSCDGAIYGLERDRKGPITVEERKRAKEITKRISDLNGRIQEHELAALKESDGEAYGRMKEELGERALQDEVDAHEKLKSDAEVEEITARLEQRLRHLLHGGALDRGATEESTE